MSTGTVNCSYFEQNQNQTKAKALFFFLLYTPAADLMLDHGKLAWLIKL